MIYERLNNTYTPENNTSTLVPATSAKTKQANTSRKITTSGSVFQSPRDYKYEPSQSPNYLHIDYLSDNSSSIGSSPSSFFIHRTSSFSSDEDLYSKYVLSSTNYHVKTYDEYVCLTERKHRTRYNRDIYNNESNFMFYLRAAFCCDGS
jgi:hypothetical protein